MSNFTVFRNDRNNLSSVHAKESVLKAINNHFCLNSLTLTNPSLESLTVSFKTVNFKIIL